MYSPEKGRTCQPLPGSTLEDGRVDVDEDHKDHDASEDEHQDDKDEADHKAGLGLESVSKEGIEDQEDHVGNH